MYGEDMDTGIERMVLPITGDAHYSWFMVSTIQGDQLKLCMYNRMDS